MHGVFAIDKPAGLTSHDVVERARRALGGAKVGHAGTLDPQATGVLVLCVGGATKISAFLLEAAKEYEGVGLLGIATDSQDAEGVVIEKKDVLCSAQDVVQSAVKYVGDIQQVPPMFSAVKIGGQKLYRLARRGVSIERPARPVTVHALEITSVELPEFRFRIRCSKGTYVRSIVHDIGQDLGCGAHLHQLRRTRQGPFDLAGAMTWAEMESANAAECIRAKIIAPSKALEFLPPVRVVLPVRGLRSGTLVDEAEPPAQSAMRPHGTVRIVLDGGRTAAMARRSAEGLRVVYVFPSPVRAPKRRAS
ncbi:MAG TPA: tRNA pseudouridine(55) synthase TruB [bacterium]|nr:tRNA pseudouridine(55) synthase TruB [bacterium]